MVFDNSYFEDEVRDGFYVPCDVKRAWAAQLEVLNDIDKVCRENGIEYFAEWGTLLGAVRHKGFIPWDDDMDISMKRHDYEKFLKIAKDKLPEGYDLYNVRTDKNVRDMLSRVINGRKIDCNKIRLEKYHDFPYVVGIDIFPLDYISRNKDENELQQNLIKLVAGVAAHVQELSEKQETLSQDEIRELSEQVQQVENLCGVRINRNDNVAWQLNCLVDKLSSIYREDEADYITIMAVWNEAGRLKFPKEYYKQSIRMSFENITIPVPISYEEVLKTRYGDYMKLVRNKAGHDYPFFSKQQEQLRRVIGKTDYSFSYDAAVRNKEAEINSGYRSLIKNALYDMKLKIEEIGHLSNAEHTDVVRNTLADIQQLAVNMGTLIEKVKGEGTDAVIQLEEMCELVYAMYQNGEGNLSEKFSQLESVIESQITDRREVVIMTYKAGDWKYAEQIWKSEKEKPDTDIYVVVMPYYYKDFLGNYTKCVYEGDKYDKELNVICANDFDIKVHYPDVIYTQNPYDGENAAISVSPEFYSDTLKKICKKLIYVQSFRLYEFSTINEREYKNMAYYCTVPGVVNADITYVTSEKIRQVYIKKLTEFAGSDTEELWKKKIQVTPHNIKKDDIKKIFNNNKKTVLIYNTAGGLMQNGEVLLKTFEDIFNAFKMNKDSVNVLWCIEEQAKDMINNMKPELIYVIKSLSEKFETEKIGRIYQDTDKDVLASCDAYYGDVSEVIQLFRNDGKPVCIIDYDVM